MLDASVDDDTMTKAAKFEPLTLEGSCEVIMNSESYEVVFDKSDLEIIEGFYRGRRFTIARAANSGTCAVLWH